MADGSLSLSLGLRWRSQERSAKSCDGGDFIFVSNWFGGLTKIRQNGGTSGL